MNKEKWLRSLLLLMAMLAVMPTVIYAKTSSELNISDNGIVFLCNREGFSPTCYYDGNQSSIGYGTKCGSSAHASGQHSITKEAAKEAMLKEINSRSIPNIRKQTNGISMNQNQFDALVSFTYNTGGGTKMIKNSPLVKYLEGTLTEDEARSQYSNYIVTNSATGKVSQALINRRNKEANLFFSGSSTEYSNLVRNNSFLGYIPINTYALSGGKKTVYDANGNAYSISSRYIDGSTDLCTISEIYTNGFCKVTYPTSNGSNTAYAKLSDFMVSTSPTQWNANGKYTAYRKSSGSETIGSVANGDRCLVLGTANGRTQVIYPTSSSHKMGWINGTISTAKYALDLNGLIDWENLGDLGGYGTADVYLNGKLVADDVNDYYNTEVLNGTTYEIKDCKAKSGFKYQGVAEGSLSGTVNGGNVNVRLSFTKCPEFRVSVGTLTSPTKFTWEATKNTEHYNVKIWKGKVWEGNAYHEKVDLKTTSYEVDLPNGYYEAYVDACHGSLWSTSNIVSFTVNKPNQYTVSYNANGGSGVPGNQKKTQGVALALSSTVPARTGYTFAGWNTSADGKGTSYQAGQQYTADANLSLYAQWNIIQYSITYNANGGSGAPGNQIKNYGSATALRNDIPTKNGYTFVGWNTSADGRGTSYQAGSQYSANENVTLYAQWKENKFVLDVNGHLDSDSTASNISGYGTFDVYINGKLDKNDVSDYWAELPAGTSYEIADIKAKNGKSYGGISSGSRTGTISDATNVRLRYITITDSPGVAPVIESFGGHTYYYYDRNSTWYEAKYFSEKAGGHLVSISSSEENSFVGSLVGDRNVWIGLTDEASEGTWRWVSGEALSYKNWSSGEPNNHAQLAEEGEDYAVLLGNGSWNDSVGPEQCGFVCEIDKAYTIRYDANGGSNAPGSQNKAYGKAVTLSSAMPTWKGHTFLNWNTDINGKGMVYRAGDTYTAENDLTLYAQWKPITYIVTYNANGGSGAPSKQKKEYGKSLTLSDAVPTREGYDFIGWNSAADGSGTPYQPKALYKKNAKVTLYAQWKAALDPAVDPVIEVGSVKTSVGSTVSVPIMIKNNPGIVSMEFSVQYDTDRLTWTGIERGEFGGSIDGEVGTTLTWLGEDPRTNVTLNSTMVILTFTVKDGAKQGDAVVTVSYNEDDIFNVSEENVAFAVVPGKVTVSSHTPGDINGDGKVNNKDVMRLMRHLKYKDVDYVADALDVNGDGKVNNKDVTRLMRFLKYKDTVIF